MHENIQNWNDGFIFNSEFTLFEQFKRDYLNFLYQYAQKDNEK